MSNNTKSSNRKKSIFIIYSSITILNIITISILFSFLKKSVYNTINTDSHILQSQITNDRIDLNKFEGIVEKINKKTEPKEKEEIRNIFK